MKSKLRKGMTVTREIKPVVGVLNPSFVYSRDSDLRTKFELIRQRQAAEVKEHTVIQMKRGAK